MKKISKEDIELIYTVIGGIIFVCTIIWILYDNYELLIGLMLSGLKWLWGKKSLILIFGGLFSILFLFFSMENRIEKLEEKTKNLY